MRSLERTYVLSGVAAKILRVRQPVVVSMIARGDLVGLRNGDGFWVVELGSVLEWNLRTYLPRCALCERPVARPVRWGPYRVRMHADCTVWIAEASWQLLLEQIERDAPPMPPGGTS